MLYSQESGSIRSPINAEAFPLFSIYSAGHEDDRTFIFSLIGLYISDAAHK